MATAGVPSPATLSLGHRGPHPLFWRCARWLLLSAFGRSIPPPDFQGKCADSAFASFLRVLMDLPRSPGSTGPATRHEQAPPVPSLPQWCPLAISKMDLLACPPRAEAHSTQHSRLLLLASKVCTLS